MPQKITVKSVLNKSRKRDSWFLSDYTVNLYSGCSFNCLFCYIRGSKYGTHMERSLSVKTNSIEILDRQLLNRSRKGEYGYIVLSSATDPYLQFEKDHLLTRQALEVILKHRFPVHIITRSDLVIRDIDLLREIDKQAMLPEDLVTKPGRGTIVSFSFSTLDDTVAKIFEPGATPPSARLETLIKVKESGLLTGVSLMPLLPYISDTTESLHQLFKTLSEAKADYILPATLTLFGNGTSDSKTLMLRAVAKYYPQLLQKYENFFTNSNEMPLYYRNAFYKKMKELAAAHNLPDGICE